MSNAETTPSATDLSVTPGRPSYWTGLTPADCRVLYRTGGTAVWEWHQVLNIISFEAAQSEAEAIRRMGYRAIVVSEREFQAIGVPESYGADEYFSR